MFGEGMDMNGLLAQAQAMQAQLQQAQDELANSTFTGTAGGDLVEATMTGAGELTGLVIKPEAIDPEDAEGLADLVLAAVRDASAQVQAKAAAVMPAMPDMGSLGF
ncbi:YbaB/EbfC family nucleoid-associated protein [Luteococcus sp. H138]|uniref:YbaB/EbfC family nucleoid-associated protein n=1 Tax=unclassified Luteococcus TaxID=2639923 RepID=UPI00313C63BB